MRWIRKTNGWNWIGLQDYDMFELSFNKQYSFFVLLFCPSWSCTIICCINRFTSLCKEAQASWTSSCILKWIYFMLFTRIKKIISNFSHRPEVLWCQRFRHKLTKFFDRSWKFISFISGKFITKCILSSLERYRERTRDCIWKAHSGSGLCRYQFNRR